ncbi:MAG: hypothetical protein JOZ41_13540 [Chloroflexi bacterium]|nr:hypothetical protein [Chloroflexota bacterium]
MSLSLERHELRKELMAVIGAGRELSPDHDAALADVFLDYMHRRYALQPARPQPGNSLRRLGPYIAAACLALAALTFPFLVFHGGDTRPVSPAFVRRFDPDGGYYWQYWGPYRDNQPGNNQLR